MTQCPICLLAATDCPRHQTFAKHVASHLERLSVACLPPDTDFGEGDEWEESPDSSATEDTGDGSREVVQRNLTDIVDGRQTSYVAGHGESHEPTREDGSHTLEELTSNIRVLAVGNFDQGLPMEKRDPGPICSQCGKEFDSENDLR